MTEPTKCPFCLAILVTACAIVAAVGGWAVIQWFECREAGLTVLYCVQHIL